MNNYSIEVNKDLTLDVLDPLISQVIGVGYLGLEFTDSILIVYSDNTITTEMQNSIDSIIASHTATTPVVSLINTLVDSAEDTVTTSSITPSVLSSIGTPQAGSYVINFSGNIYTAGASAKGQFGIYVDGVILPETRRDISCALTLLGGLVTVSVNAIGVGTQTSAEIEVDGTQTIDVRFNSTNGGTIGFKERVLTLVQVSKL